VLYSGRTNLFEKSRAHFSALFAFRLAVANPLRIERSPSRTRSYIVVSIDNGAAVSGSSGCAVMCVCNLMSHDLGSLNAYSPHTVQHKGHHSPRTLQREDTNIVLMKEYEHFMRAPFSLTVQTSHQLPPGAEWSLALACGGA
jgi:hypothetical protein